MLACRMMLMLGFILRTALIPLALIAPSAYGQDRLSDGVACELEPGGESTVLAISNSRALLLADGRQVYLAEVLPPISGEGAVHSAVTGATAYLRAHVLGQKVEIRYGGKHQDRYGATVAHVFVAGDNPLWVQEGLVREGLAQVFPQPDNHACSKQLASLEEKARNANRGYWGLAFFKVLPARDARSLLNLVQTYQIIEGEIAFVTHTGGRAILHFAEDRQFGFTATVEPAAQKRLSEQGLDDWQGQTVRIRGWIERKRGPAIVITQPEQIELLRRQPTPPASPKLQ